MVDAGVAAAADNCPLAASTAAVWALSILLVVIVLFILLRCLIRLRAHYKKMLPGSYGLWSSGFRVRGSNDAAPSLGSPLKPGEFHLFISHTWRTGQDQPAVIKRQLQLFLPKARPRIFLDVDDLEDIAMLETHIRDSRVVCLFLSRGYFHSRACLNEVKLAKSMAKPLILVHEADAQYGGAPLVDLFDACPTELREYVFGDTTINSSTCDVITWKRVKEFHLAALTRITEALLRENALAEQDRERSTTILRGGHHGNHNHNHNCRESRVATAADAAFAGTRSLLSRMTSRAPDNSRPQVRVHLPSAATEQPVPLHGHVELLISAANPSAHAVAHELVATFASAQEALRASKAASVSASVFPATIDQLLRRTDAAIANGSRMVLLLLLDRDTFALNSERADILAQHVRVARAAHLPVLLVHDEASCDFDTCIEMTPDDLVTSGLYQRQVAIPLGEHELEKAASHVLAFRALQKLAPLNRTRRTSSLSMGNVREFDIGSLFGMRSNSRANRSIDLGDVQSGRRKGSHDKRGSCRQKRISLESLAHGMAGFGRLSNAAHVARLQELGMAPISNEVVRAAALANRRRRVSALGKLTAGPRTGGIVASPPTAAPLWGSTPSDKRLSQVVQQGGSKQRCERSNSSGGSGQTVRVDLCA